MITQPLLSKQFQRRLEQFTCEYCGQVVHGNGYTNHCSQCFTSKHVDINPGDRLATCGGLMEPIDLFLEHGEWILVHRCVRCGQQKNNRINKQDNQERLAALQHRLNQI